MTRRSYAGAANHLALAAPFNIGDPSFTTDSPIGWPDGSAGPFQVRLAKGQANEQKVLVDSRVGSTFTVSIAAWDGTTAQNHSAGEAVEIIGSSVDFDEANSHVNAALAIHGLGAGVHVVGDTTAQTLTNKSVDGLTNTITNIARAASPEIDAALTANAIADAATAAAVDTETANRTTTDAAIAANLVTETARATAAEAAEATTRSSADALLAPLASPTFTGTVVIPDASGATSPVSKGQLDASPGGKLEFGGGTYSPSGTGMVQIPHGDYTPVSIFTQVVSGNVSTFTFGYDVDVWVLGNPTKVYCHHRSDGSPVSTGGVTFYWIAVKA